MDMTALETRLTETARTAFENHRIFVYGREGVLWLATRVDALPGQCDYRTIGSVGIPKMGVRRLTAEVRRIAEAK